MPEIYPQGIDLIKEGKCPIKVATPIGCTFCRFGHMTECHFPKNCEDARCSHWEASKEVEYS